jgi:repressor of nif and glnA expression
MLSDRMLDVISSSFYEIFYELCYENQPFGLIVQNHNNWDKELPDRLKNQQQFMIKIENDTLADLKVSEDEDGVYVTIGTEFDGVFYSKDFTHEDIAGFFLIENMKPYLVKPFVLKPKAIIKKDGQKFGFDPDAVKDEDLVDSMNAFKKYNPELFEER